MRPASSFMFAQIFNLMGGEQLMHFELHLGKFAAEGEQRSLDARGFPPGDSLTPRRVGWRGRRARIGALGGRRRPGPHAIAAAGIGEKLLRPPGVSLTERLLRAKSGIAGFVFQMADGAAEGGLGDVEALGALAEAQVFRNGDKAAQ